MTRQIIAISGAEAPLAPRQMALARYALAQTGKEQPSVCFLPTASGDREQEILRFYMAFSQLECLPSHLELFRAPPLDIEQQLHSYDLIFVGDGIAHSMLAVWRAWGIPGILRRAWERGVLLAGQGAGALCWFEQGASELAPGKLSVVACMALLNGSLCPRFDQPGYRAQYQDLVLSGAIAQGFGLDDGAALHMVDQQLQAVVSAAPQAAAYQLRYDEGALLEQRIEPYQLKVES